MVDNVNHQGQVVPRPTFEQKRGRQSRERELELSEEAARHKQCLAPLNQTLASLFAARSGVTQGCACSKAIGSLNNAIHWRVISNNPGQINYYPVDSVVRVVNTCPLYSDLSSG